jgi:thymidine kinase
MSTKRKENYISDKRRLSCTHAIYSRLYRGKSILIEGDYGVGKSQFLKRINPKKLEMISLESLNKTHELLASILQQLNFEAKSAYHLMSQHLTQINKQTGFAIIIDEANDLDYRVWPYFKRIIDANIPIIFAGSPKVRTYLTHSHPDILSRLKVLVLYPIIVEDFILECKEFEPEAIEQIYVSTGGDMRRFKEICTDCRDKAAELKHSKIDVNLAMSFLANYQFNRLH